MLSCRFWIGLPVMLMTLASQVQAGIFHHHGGHHHAGCCGNCCVQYVEKVVMQPTVCPEVRQVVCTEYRQEMREHRYMEIQCVTEKKPVVCNYTVMVPQVRTQLVNYTVCKPVVRQVVQNYQVCIPTWTDKPVQYTVCVPVWTDRQVSYTVNVPHVEQRQAVRRICRSVPHEVHRQVVRDCGHWAVQNYCVQCGCDPCGRPIYRNCCRKVWVPNLVTEDITCTVYKPAYFDEPYNYCVTVCRPEQRVRVVRECSYRQEVRQGTVRVCGYRYEQRQCTHNVCEYKPEVHQKEVQYTVCVPEVRQCTQYVLCPKKIAVERTCMVPVCVPHQVQRQVTVNVCKMVPKTIMVPVCGGCNCCP